MRAQAMLDALDEYNEAKDRRDFAEAQGNDIDAALAEGDMTTAEQNYNSAAGGAGPTSSKSSDAGSFSGDLTGGL